MPTALVLLVEKASIQADQAANNLALGVEADDGKRGEVEADDDMWLPLATQLIASVSLSQPMRENRFDIYYRLMMREFLHVSMIP